MSVRLLIAGIVCALATTAQAQAQVQAPVLERSVINEGGVSILTPKSDVDSIVLSNDQIIGVDVQGLRQILVFGRKEGSSELLLLDRNKRPIARHMFEVVSDASAVSDLINQSAPGAKIKVAKAAGVVVLSGTALNSAQSQLAANIATSAMAGAKVINLIQSASSDQLAVSVRVMEVRKTHLRELGIRWAAQNRFNDGVGSIGNLFASAIGGAGTTDLFASARFTIDRLTLDSFINFLRSEGAATMLAEPTMVATSGQKAKFLAGGEIPVPTPITYNSGTNNAQGYTFKPYGITLEFTAEILDDTRLKLILAPEVSSIDDSRVVEFAGAKVPGIVTRKTETTVTLNFGESVAIAGLRASEQQKDRRGLPFATPFGLGDVLAGNNNSSRSDTELVLIVTPERVEDAAARMPTVEQAIKGLVAQK
ncbi:type II and III secretion system protein family protein [Caulobacter henricii]|uniref:Uncharacterized protein n=1 Tax=Caulobacter henricii TaxID=69395 RepID=A0A0P0NYX3_9CAUL|nr:pilus assembly protein N-terminal domain-containing protein [Caulobacter henricii]ALL13089.1 hypothetical protein AQ619_06840 [Caulobacter henricii]